MTRARQVVRRLRLPRAVAARRVRVVVLGARVERAELVHARSSSLVSGRENAALWAPRSEPILASRGNA